jgi:cobalamin biosynthetic protein CobC
MLVLRSFGKYFGLAGIRIGFAFCKGALKEKIEQVLGLWMINGPAQYLASKAMRDTHWQATAIDNINSASRITQQLFEPLMAHINALSTTVAWETHQALFSSYQMAENTAIDVQHHFASNGILLRVIKLPIRLETEQQAQLAQVQYPQALLRVGVLGLENQQQHSRVRECITALIKSA